MVRFARLPALALLASLTVATAQERPADHPPAPAAPPAAAAQPAPPAAAARPERRREAPAPQVAGPRLPPFKESRHAVALAGRTLDVVAGAGAITLNDAASGAARMEIAFVSYRLAGGGAERPIVFALNGGPGSASAWLHLGGLGPWRLAMEGEAVSPSAPPLLLPNDETWLDFADLVFVDPVGTGYSRLVVDDEATRRSVFSVEGDIDTLAVFVRRYLEQSGRPASRKFIVGESYAGLRGPLMARRLQQREAIGVDGLILVSPALDLRRSRIVASAIGDAALLPTMTAVAQARRGGFDAAGIAAAEAYAASDHIVDLMKGRRDGAAQARIAERVAGFAGLDPALVREHGGRVSSWTFRRAIGRPEGRLPSAYDATVTVADPAPGADHGGRFDAFTDGLSTPLTGAMLDLLHARLGWKPEGRYRLSNAEVNRAWDWGRGRGGPEALSALSEAMSLDARLRVLVAHGYFDLVTPYFETKLAMQLLPDFGPRLSFAVYPGGHMFYSRRDSRAAFRDAAAVLMR